MNFKLLSSGLILATILQTGCTRDDSAKKDIEHTLETIEDAKTPDIPEIPGGTDPMAGFENPLASLQTGGQPGLIKLLGAMVLNPEGANPRFVVEAQGGIGHSGDFAKVDANHQPQFQSEAGESTVEIAANSLIAMGCDDDTVIQLMEGTELLRHDLPETQELNPDSAYSRKSLAIAAHTVVFCGDIELQVAFLSVDAKEILFKNSHISQVETFGALNFSTADLKLLGENSIETSAPDTNLTLLDASSITISVKNSIADLENGSLKVKSRGSNFKAE